jgi:HEAT repeat protein
LPVKVAAADVLREMGPRAAKAVPALAKIAGDRNRWVRSFACNALGNVGPAAAPAIDALLAVVQHEDPYTRRHAVTALGQIGPAAVKAVPALKERADDTAEKDDVRDAAIAALYQVNLAQIERDALKKASKEIRELSQRLRSNDQFEAVPAAKTLARKGSEARLAVPSLALALQCKNKWIREAAARALGEMGREAKVVRPALEQAAADPELEVHEAAEKALAKISE